MLNNLKIRARLLVSFSVVIILMFFSVTVGVIELSAINARSNNVYYKDIRTLETLEKVKAKFSELRRATLKTIVFCFAGDSENTEAAIEETNQIYNDLQKAEQEHLNKLSGPEFQDERKVIDEALQRIYRDYWNNIQKINEACKSGDFDTAMLLITHCTEIAADVESEIDALYNSKMAESSKNTEEITNIVQDAIMILLLTGTAAVTVSFVMAIVTGNSFSKQIARLRKVSQEIAKGNLDLNPANAFKNELGDLSRDLAEVTVSLKNVTSGLSGMTEEFREGIIQTKIDSSGFHGVYKKIADEVNGMFALNIKEVLGFLEGINQFAVGNFNAELEKLPKDKVCMNITFDLIKSTLTSIVNDVGALARDAAQGKLSNRIATEKYKGDWAKITEALNCLIAAVATPIEEAETVLAQIAAGSFENQIMGDYRGDFLRIKESVNNMTKNMDSYIGEISNILGLMAQNDLEHRIHREYVGKFSDIKDAINYIVEKLNRIISEILSSAVQVSAGARQISESSVVLAHGTTEQASSVEEMSATIQAINESTAENAGKAKEAELLSGRAKDNAARCNQEMKNMLSSMDDIRKSSDQISNITKVIDEIAFQINLLSLNATVEAAHAGSHGKGFAVVADEVRTLAAKSQEAARETAQLIGESIEKVNEGAKIAGMTADSLQTIVDDAGEMAAIITGIAAASKEQSAVVGQVAEALAQITEVVQNNSATSEESAAAAEELSGQSDILRNLVGVFKLK